MVTDDNMSPTVNSFLLCGGKILASEKRIRYYYLGASERSYRGDMGEGSVPGSTHRVLLGYNQSSQSNGAGPLEH